MFKFLETVESLRKDVDILKYEVLPASPDKEKYGDTVLESRLSNLEEKFDALLTHLKLTTDYTESVPEVESKLIIRKRTKKDDEPKLPGDWGSIFGYGRC